MRCLPWFILGYSSSRSHTVAIRILLLASMLMVLAGCGGGDGGKSSSAPPPTNNVSMSVSTQLLAVTAKLSDPAPASSIQVFIAGQHSGQDVYMGATSTKNGIAALSYTSGSSPVNIGVQFKPPSSLTPGTYTDTISIFVCYDTPCVTRVTNSPQTVQVSYTVSDTTVKVTSLLPASAMAGTPAFQLTVNGSSFSNGSQVLWNGGYRATTFVSSTQLTAQIASADIANPGAVQVSVNDPINGPSNFASFTITPAQLSLQKISPSQVYTDDPSFSLSAIGTGFSNSSVILWNGSARPTTFESQSLITAQISAADIATIGTASITVQDLSSSVKNTDAQTLTVSAPSIDAVAFQINPAHTGSVKFASASFPTAPSWTVDVGGVPSYALIAQGKIFVTVSLGSGGSQVLALDQVTGAKVWGPVAIGGTANAAYDRGKLLILSSPFASAATMEALDAQTGDLLWSTLLQGQYSFSGAPTARDGFVYAGGAGSGGTLYALDESNGAITWEQSVENGDNSSPAVTVDGVFVTYPCWTYNFRPATGDDIWSVNTGCEGGGGATPVVANQLVYSPNGVSGYSGSIYTAATGASMGTYNADTPPAFTSDTGYFLQTGTLRGLTISNSTINWSFAGDGHLDGAPIAINQYVFIASNSGNLYALNGSTGQQVWQVTLPAPPALQTSDMPMSSLSAGDGLLVVPAGTRVVVYTISANP